MNKITTAKRFILIILSSTILLSCSVSKRKYLHGYHVEWWHNANSRAAPVAKQVKKTHPIIAPNAVTAVSSPVPDNQKSLAPKHIILHANPDRKENNKITEPDKLQPEVKTSAPGFEGHPGAGSAPTTEGNATTSLVLGLLVIVIPIASVLIGLALYPAGANDDSLAAFIAVAVVIWLVCTIGAFVTGIVALHRIKQSNGALTGKGSAIAGIVLSGLVLFGLLCLILAVVL